MEPSRFWVREMCGQGRGSEGEELEAQESGPLWGLAERLRTLW